MSLYADYVKEREGYETLENEYGFASYIFGEDGCYIRDIYVKPEYRKQKQCLDLAENISSLAKARGCRELTGSICIGTNGDTESMRVLISYGFKLSHLGDGDMIYLKKELT